MSNPIRDSLHSYHSVLPRPTASPARQTSFQQAAIQAQQAQISFVTDEGDVVTLSHAQSQAQAISATQQLTPVGFGQNFTLASLNIENFALSVQGDLSEEELADIKNLMEDLTDIATDFFNGELGAAMVGAMSLGDMGSISELAATFSYTAAVSTQASANMAHGHPLPIFDPSAFNLADELDDEMEAEELVGNQYVDMLQAQWQQVVEMLDKAHEVREEQEAVQPAEPQTATDTAQKMMERIKDTVTEHPRLSPFAGAFADKAIKDAMDLSEHKEMIKSANQLRKDIHKELRDWLVAI